MNGWIGITDNEWFTFLSRQPEIDEINFWQPGDRTRFKSLKPRGPFLFKLHSPHHFIAGGSQIAWSDPAGTAGKPVLTLSDVPIYAYSRWLERQESQQCNRCQRTLKTKFLYFTVRTEVTLS